MHVITCLYTKSKSEVTLVWELFNVLLDQFTGLLLSWAFSGSEIHLELFYIQLLKSLKVINFHSFIYTCFAIIFLLPCLDHFFHSSSMRCKLRLSNFPFFVSRYLIPINFLCLVVFY